MGVILTLPVDEPHCEDKEEDEGKNSVEVQWKQPLRAITAAIALST
jgi:hypothetical protein